MAKSFSFRSGGLKSHVLNQGRLYAEARCNVTTQYCSNRGVIAGKRVALTLEENLLNEGEILGIDEIELTLGNHCRNHEGRICAEAGDISISTKAHISVLFKGSVLAPKGKVLLNAKQVTLDREGVLKGRLLGITVKERFQREAGFVPNSVLLRSQKPVVLDKP